MMNQRLNGHQYLLTIALLTGLALPLHSAAQIHKWVDEDGVTHFSERPPKNTPTTVIKPKTGHSEPVVYGNVAPQPDDAEAAIPEGMVSETEYHKERCDVARQNLEALKRSGRIQVRGDDGKPHFLNEEEQRQRVLSNQQIADESCQR